MMPLLPRSFLVTWIIKASLLIPLLVLSACSDSKSPSADPIADPIDPTVTPTQISEPGVRFIACPFGDFRAPEGFRCGVLDTYENYESTGADARVIQMAFGIMPAQETPVAADPVVIFIGGPGASALELVAFVENSFLEEELGFSRNRDVIFVDQRGTGFSTPFLNCNLDGLRGDGPIDVAATRECVAGFEQQGVDLSQYRSKVIAQDFKVLREALGIEQWNVYGESYGPIPGILYAELDPSGVRSVIFDSSTDNQVDIALADVAAPFNFFTELSRQCAAEAACNARVPNLGSTIIDTYNALENEPWVGLLGLDEFYFDEFFFLDVVLGEDGIFAPALIEMFSTRNVELLNDLVSYDGQRLRKSRLNVNKRANRMDESNVITDDELAEKEFADLMHAAVQCAAIDAENYASAVVTTEEEWPSDLIELARETVFYPPICTSGVFSIEQDLTQRTPVSLDVPALILGGGLDTLVSLVEVQKLTESFTSPNLVVAAKSGHGVYLPAFNDCVDDIVTSFLEDPSSAVDQSCLPATNEPFLFDQALLDNF